MGDRARSKWAEKLGRAAVPLSVGGAGFPSNTMFAWAEAYTSVPSDILIHPTVWSQYTNVTDRHTGHCCRSIGRTVTCKTVARKRTLVQNEQRAEMIGYNAS